MRDFLQVTNDTDFRAFVGLAPGWELSLMNASKPQNVLFLTSQSMKAITRNDVNTVLENRTGYLDHR